MIEATDSHSRLPESLQAAVLDWAGTTVDFGSRAPVAAMQSVFETFQVEVSSEEVRGPMGRAKRDHLSELLRNPDIADRWLKAQGKQPGESDIDALYDGFLDIQATTVAEESNLIEGCVEAVQTCRDLGLRIGSSTGYTRALLEPVLVRARQAGYEPEVALTADDVSQGRPAPWLCFEIAKRLNIYPMSALVKVDDTTAGIQAGRNAGAWAVGVVDSGNEVGLSLAEWNDLDKNHREDRRQSASQRLLESGAHLLISTIAELPQAIARINELLKQGISPA